MENKRLLPPRARAERPPQGDDLAMLLLLSSASAPLPPVQSLPLRVHLHSHGPPTQLAAPVPLPLLLPPPTAVLAAATAVGAPPPPRQRRILPRPSPLELHPPPPSGVKAEDTAGDSPPSRQPVSRSASGMSAHSTASSCPSVADLVAELAVAPPAAASARSRMRTRSPHDAPHAASPDSGTTTGASVDPNNDDNRPSSPSPSPGPGPNPSKPASARKKRIRVKTERRREQCRANQARYRNKQRDHAVVLAERVEELRAEVRLLAQQRRGGSAMGVATEYFRLFRHGLAADEPAAPTVLAAAPFRQQQLAFLRSSTAPKLQLGWDVGGVDALVEQWRRYSQYHDDLVLELESAFEVDTVALNESVSKTIHAAASLTVTITPETIARVFPHLASGAADACRLKDRLVGARVSYPWIVVFEFDERCIIQRLTNSVDFVAPLMAVLRSVEEVLAVLEGARVQHAWHLGPGVA
ncbi:hypothetical protein PybrP1_012276 [[Pythium] brassicae (nom. inval.)]|nr:hypothetical protein PybrP1_012276 [[Pythium] brassicae (nom. inval.)]